MAYKNRPGRRHVTAWCDSPNDSKQQPYVRCIIHGQQDAWMFTDEDGWSGLVCPDCLEKELGGFLPALSAPKDPLQCKFCTEKATIKCENCDVRVCLAHCNNTQNLCLDCDVISKYTELGVY